MSSNVRDLSFDVVLAAGPGVDIWPSIGARTLSTLCSEAGLSVGWVGGDHLKARGVVPLPGTGGLVLAEDLQRRMHRMHARALVRVSAPSMLPDPFPGWNSKVVIPLMTAQKLRREAEMPWTAPIAILGTGNRALRFGSVLLSEGCSEVVCIEAFTEWGAKRYSGWEVEKRQFEMLGGRIIEAKPKSLVQKSALVWEFRLEDEFGVRLLEVNKVISAGPFRDLPGVREYPPGSVLFELEQTALLYREEDADGWTLEEERAKWLATKIIKALKSDLGSKKEEVESLYKRARSRLKKIFQHREEPFLPSFQGKWITPLVGREIRAFSGTPKKEHRERVVASIECIEHISCNLCEKVCPTSAIHFSRFKTAKETLPPVLNESACIACGLCLEVCPSSTPILMHEKEDVSYSNLVLSWRGKELWDVGEFVTLVNRRGESLGSARISAILKTEKKIPFFGRKSQLLQLEVPTHLIWDARGVKRTKPKPKIEKDVERQLIEVTMNGDKRLVRDKIPLTLAFYETGQNREVDGLFCKDGSCGLCQVTVDSVKKLACQTPVHRGMAVKFDPPSNTTDEVELCPCLKVKLDEVVERFRQGQLQSVDAVLAATSIGEGKCHGQVCAEPFRRLLTQEGLDLSQWIDWRFPWTDWNIQ